VIMQGQNRNRIPDNGWDLYWTEVTRVEGFRRVVREQPDVAGKDCSRSWKRWQRTPNHHPIAWQRQDLTQTERVNQFSLDCQRLIVFEHFPVAEEDRRHGQHQFQNSSKTDQYGCRRNRSPKLFQPWR